MRPSDLGIGLASLGIGLASTPSEKQIPRSLAYLASLKL
jgi:hypothetical protein